MTLAAIKNLSNKQIAALLAVVVFVFLVATAPQMGLTWDEPAYIVAAESYSAWFGELLQHPGQALSQEVIDPYWEVNHEHPPIDKIWSGLVWSVARHVFDDLTAHRLGNMLLVAALVAMLYLLVTEVFGRRAGLLSVAALLTMPRFFFHSHLASLDVPAAVTIFTVVYAFWKTKDKKGIQYGLFLGLAWGIAMATKVNAAFVMPALFIWMLLYQREGRLFGRLVLAGFVAFIVFVASWPWLYPDPLTRMNDYYLFITVDHWEIGQFYLHQFHMPPPWHFAFVMIVAVTPLALMLAALLGTWRTWKARSNDQGSLGVLFLLNALLPIIMLAIGKSMVYDNDRLMMPAFVFLAALAGIGLHWLLTQLSAALAARQQTHLTPYLTIGLLALAYIPQLVVAVTFYPHLLSYYSASVGGLRGATALGLETTYWCETYNEALDFINANAEPGDYVWVDPYSNDVMTYYQLQGRLRDDVWILMPEWGSTVFGEQARLRRANFTTADFIVLQYRQTSLAAGGNGYGVLDWVADNPPDMQVAHSGIPLVEVYDMR